MKYFFVVVLILLILSLPLGGFEILTGGRFRTWSSWCRPTLVKAAKWIVRKIPAPVRKALLIIWFVVFFVVATPLVFVFNYFVLWATLVVETWGHPDDSEIENPARIGSLLRGEEPDLGTIPVPHDPGVVPTMGRTFQGIKAGFSHARRREGEMTPMVGQSHDDDRDD